MNWPPFFRSSDVEGFFDAVENALANSTEWRLHGREQRGADRFLSVDYVGSSFDGRNLGFVLSNYTDKPSHVQLTMHAERWAGDRSGPIEDEYLSAERMTGDMFRQVATLLKRRVVLCRPRKRKRMVGKLAEKFAGFCARSTDHWTGEKVRHLHQSEHEYFYQFVCTAHRFASALTPEELYSELHKAGFSQRNLPCSTKSAAGFWQSEHGNGIGPQLTAGIRGTSERIESVTENGGANGMNASGAKREDRIPRSHCREVYRGRSRAMQDERD